MSGETKLRRSIQRLKPGLQPPQPQPLRPDPTNPFELAIAERLGHLQKELDELKGKFNWLLTIIIGAALTNIVIALIK